MDLSIIAGYTLPFLLVAIGLAFWRLVKGPTLPDRVVAMDLLSTFGTAVIVVYALTTDRAVFLDVALVLALISFLGTVAFAFYIDQRQ